MATHRYPALRTIAAILIGIGWLAIGICALLVLEFAIGSSGGRPLFGPLGGGLRAISMIGSFVLGISWVALGELIRLFIDIEKNTRTSAVGAAQPAKSTAETARAGSLPSEKYEPKARSSTPSPTERLEHIPAFRFSKGGLILIGVAVLVLVIVLLL